MFLCEVTNPIWQPCIIWQDLLRKNPFLWSFVQYKALSIYSMIHVNLTEVMLFLDTDLLWCAVLVWPVHLAAFEQLVSWIFVLLCFYPFSIDFLSWQKKKNWWQEWDSNPWQKAVLHRSVRHSANWPMEDSLNTVVQMTAFCMWGQHQTKRHFLGGMDQTTRKTKSVGPLPPRKCLFCCATKQQI